jgi:hypothetical protein
MAILSVTVIRRLFYSCGIAGVVLLAACSGLQPPIGAPLTRGSVDGTFQNHHTFHYTGAVQSFVVPANTTLIKVVALGAAGGVGGPSKSEPARGGRVSALLPVRPGERLRIYVGGAGYPDGSGGYFGGFNGGGNPGDQFGGIGGGGASDVREGGRTLRFRILVAGGGGGWGGIHEGGRGGDGGGRGAGGSGKNGGYSYGSGGGGGGGTQIRGGAGGAAGAGYGGATSGRRGHVGVGGDGGNSGYGSTSSSASGSGGGGGGGYYGGGGGGGGSGSSGGKPGGGGGGGSCYVEPTAKITRMQAGWKNATGNGLVVISW